MNVIYHLKIFLCFISFIQAQDPDCDYKQDVQLGVTYYVYSKNYPNNYPPGKICRWQATCPVGTRCVLDCPEIFISPSAGCIGDKLFISKKGDPYLIGANIYCGNGTAVIVSESNTISVALITTSTTTGYRFLCKLRAQPADCQCGYKSQARIVGGAETKINEYPMMVGLVDLNKKMILCGGTIISPNYIITSAHCVENQPVSQFAILYGEHNTKLSDSTYTGIVGVDSIIINPNYNTSGVDNDVALLKTKTPVPFSIAVGPACIPFTYETTLLDGKDVDILGWGSQSFAGSMSDYLQKATVNVMSQSSCLSSWFGTYTNNMLCTYAFGKDSCQFDSGGPVLYMDPTTAKTYVVGIISGGYGCGFPKPSINMKVSNYARWIMNTVPDTLCVY